MRPVFFWFLEGHRLSLLDVKAGIFNSSFQRQDLSCWKDSGNKLWFYRDIYNSIKIKEVACYVVLILPFTDWTLIWLIKVPRKWARIHTVVNNSLRQGELSAALKEVQVSILKKPNLNLEQWENMWLKSLKFTLLYVVN